MEIECDLGHVGNRHHRRSKLRWGMDRETMERGEVRRLSINVVKLYKMLYRV